MSDAPEIVVVGAGVTGLACARALARAGTDVLVLEQFALDHTRGSSHGAARIFRLAYDDARFVRLAQQALPLWRELEREAGEPLLTTTGSLDVGFELAAHRLALEQCGVAFELLSASEARRFGLALPAGTKALVQEDGGVLHADRALLGLRASGAASGARVMTGERVEGLEVREDLVRVRTSTETLTAAAAVVAAGAWVAGLLEPLGIRLPVEATRETVTYFPLGKHWPRPTVIDWRPPPGSERLPRRGQGVYALPSPDSRLKVGIHQTGPGTDPDEEGSVDPDTVRCAADWVAEHFSDIEPKPVFAETCIYTNTPDESFILERQGRLVIGSACSGHGFKFAPAVGKELARLAIAAAS